MTRVKRIQSRGKRQQVRLYLEGDPLRILQMGNYFDTCLSIDRDTAFSTVANAVDANKSQKQDCP